MSLSSGWRLIRSAASRSVSREAVPLPIAMSSQSWALASFRQDVDRLVPAALRLVRVDRRGAEHLARGVGDRDLDAGPETRVQAHGGPGAGRGGQQQVAQVGGEHPDRLVLGRLPQPDPDVHAQVHQDAGPPGPVHGGGQPRIGRPALVAEAETVGDARLVLRVVGPRVQGEVEDLLLLAAEQRQDAVRGQPRERLAELEVVGELGALGLLALAHLRDERAAGGHRLAQLAEQVRVLGEPLDQDGAGAFESGDRVRDALIGVDEVRGRLLGVVGRFAEQQVGQRLQACLAGDLRLSTPFRLVGQVEILQPGLGAGGADLRFELFGELALGLDLLKDRFPALVEFAQVAQPLLERAELRVVERAGGFLAVPGDERHGSAAVEQLDRGADLTDAHAELAGDPLLHRLVLRHQSIVPAVPCRAVLAGCARAPRTLKPEKMPCALLADYHLRRRLP